MTAPHVVTPADLPAPYSGPPLNVGWVGNYRHPWCSEVHFTKSMESLGHKVWRFQELPAEEGGTDWKGLPARIAREGIQALFWTRTWPAEMDVVVPVLEELRAEGIPTISYHLDKWFSLNRQHQVDDQPFFRTDLVVSPDDSPLWPEHGVNHFWLPPGVYGPECEPVAPNPRRWPYDVVFVGSHPYPHPEWAKYRSDLISSFSRAFRGRFGVLPRRGVPIRGRDLQELYATVPVVLGDSCLAGESFGYVSDRVTESLGRGACLIHPLVDGMIGDVGSWWVGDHPNDTTYLDLLGYYLGDFNEAVQLARWGIANPDGARAVGEHGRATVLARDTYAHRMGTVLAVAEGIHGGYRDVGEGTGWKIDDVRIPPGVESVTVEVSVVGNLLLGSEGTGWRDTPSTPRYPQRSVHLHDWSAIFHPRPRTTDAEVVQEVWGTNDYRVPPGGFSGTVVDIGANVGAFSVLAAKAGAHRVLAFEPQFDNHERLVHHLYLNGVREVVEPERTAITGGATFVFMEGEGGGARSVERDGNGDRVTGCTLADMLSAVGPVEFIKCDVESAEYGIFAACPVEALANVQTIALEFHGPAMPHLSHLDDDGKHLERWGALVAKLADAGRVETFGHPMRGGLIWWKRYGA